MVEEFDDDGSGLIEFEEFLVLMAKKVDSPIQLFLLTHFCPLQRIKIYPSDLRVIKVGIIQLIYFEMLYYKQQ